ncbi:DUF2141 domain-containing protein [Spirosoma fluviale]|uniref:Uncharacterized conserved protein, DUF2141 family n=1 Tax=Spirosoma fluviale TaxID=1597977 RepID=A0A286GU83_9BACT|nr:DUF2141 domain-containing protein [Spirosoma fluviale]SOD99068.1 Uncharacterized conserved protein, DUF2141 family [Spirosoma fluviale]
MLHHVSTILLVHLLATTLTRPETISQQPALLINITNIQPNQGKVVVEIYRNASDWLTTPLRKQTLSSDQVTRTATFDVPPGRYAVSIYQDVNTNGKLDQNFIGIPKEPFGFGNNYRPFGKPKFESCIVEFNAGSKPETIKLYKAL